MKKITILTLGLVTVLVCGFATKQSLSSGTIKACISKVGLIRVIDNYEVCRRNETSFSFGESTGQLSGGFIGDLSNINLDSVDFSYHNLTNNNFSNSNLPNTLFRHTNLTGSNLTNVNFTGADLERAIITNIVGLNTVKWYSCPGDGCSPTICPDGTKIQIDGSTCLGHLTF